MYSRQKKNKKLLVKLAQRIKMVVFDFDGVFTDNRVLVLEDGREGVFCCRGDGLGLKRLNDLGVITLAISMEVNPVISVRCRKLNLACIQNCNNKLKTLEDEAKKYRISLEEIAYLGNDVNDLGCLQKVGLPACVPEAHKDVFKACRYITKFPAGYGAVRDFCDFISEVKNEKLSK